ncbi:MAG: Gfo/Idh/MocA family oxidoreductase [Victivallaceae bacterium]|nr:Gfo/Idh/MocA family oxidoreductase [Victivallaceae bacterium]
MDKVKWLLVGAGDIAHKRVAPALAGAENSELAGICDVRKEPAAQIAEKFKLKYVYTDFEEALARSDADAVYLATPVWLHPEQAVKVLNAGKNVLVEKPLGLDANQCRTVIQAAKLSGKKAGCAYYRRYFKRYEYARNMLANGEFGKVVNIRMTYYSWFAPETSDPKHWRVEKRKSGGGPLSDMGTHMFDVLIGLFGMPEKVYAKCANLVNNWNVEDSAVIIMELEKGTQVTASFNWNSKTWRHEFEIVGTEAKLDWLPYDCGAIVKTVGRNIEQLEMPEPENVHAPLIRDFNASILSGRTPSCSVEEAAKTNILLDAVYKSAAENREIKVSL